MKTALVVALAACLASVDGNIFGKRRRLVRRQIACQLSQWVTDGGYQYSYNDRREDFATAQAACEACGASLASVHSPEENNFIRSLAPPGESLFIGFTDKGVESQWLWLDGTGADYKNWRAGSKASLAEPDDVDSEGQGNADCAYITANGIWRDLLCSSLRRSVCKRALPVLTTVSEPRTEAPLPPQTEAPHSEVPVLPQTEVPLPLKTNAPQLPEETEAPLETAAPLLPATDAPQTAAPLPPVTEAPKTQETEAPFQPQTEAPELPTTTAKTTERPDDGYRRTVILMERRTSWGENVFLRGGSSGDGRAVAIRYRDLSALLSRDHTKLYDAWKQGDGQLDWSGPEAQQGTFNGMAAQGTPSVWTTNNKDDPLGRYHPLNTFGEHYWVLDVDMDCTKTSKGLFELKGYLGAWETGSNHQGKCGALNVFHWGSSSSTTSSLP